MLLALGLASGAVVQRLGSIALEFEKVRFEFEDTRPMMSDTEILEDLKRVSSELGTAVVPIREYTRLGKFAQTTVKKRFGSWNRALADAQIRRNHRRNDR